MSFTVVEPQHIVVQRPTASLKTGKVRNSRKGQLKCCLIYVPSLSPTAIMKCIERIVKDFYIASCLLSRIYTHCAEELNVILFSFSADSVQSNKGKVQ